MYNIFNSNMKLCESALRQRISLNKRFTWNFATVYKLRHKECYVFCHLHLLIIGYAICLPGESNTFNYVETNLAENDNSATPDLKNSQLHVEGRSIDVSSNNVQTDWLACVSDKTGLPRLLLAGFLVICFLCITCICLSESFSLAEKRTPEVCVCTTLVCRINVHIFDTLFKALVKSVC